MAVVVTRAAPGAPPFDKKRLCREGSQMLACLGLPQAELSVLLTSDHGIQKLNHQYRDKNRPTDVLAFAQDEALGIEGQARLLGDVVISLETAARQAKSRRRPLGEEACFLLAHGLLHLVGYDHGSPPEKRVMDRMTRRLIRSTAAKSSTP